MVTPATSITIALAMVAVLAMIALPRGRALGVLVMSMMLWPEYLRIPLGLAQMSVPRIAAIALIAKLLTARKATPLRWTWVDLVVLVGWAWDLLANLAEDAGAKQMTYLTGRIFDTACMYGAARLSLRSLRDLTDMYAPIALTAVLMGTFGAYEAVTTNSMYNRLYEYGAQAWFDKEAEFRYGFYRARASTAHAIYFGMAMTIITGVVYAMRDFARWRAFWPISVIGGLVGVLSSLSSGPQLALVVLLGTSIFLYARRLIKPALVALLALCIVVEFASNRHFYSLIDYLALSSETAWYRTRLMEVAVSHVSDYWLFGVGDRWPHHWGLEIDTRLHVDVVNHYIIVALYGGLPSLACLVTVLVTALRSAGRVASGNHPPAARRLGFGLACTLIALGVASLSVGLFGPALLLTYILMGLMVALRVTVDAPMSVEMVHPDAPANAQRQDLPALPAGFGAPR